MTTVSFVPIRRLSCLAVVCAAALATPAGVRADEPDVLPLPRAKTPSVLNPPADDGGNTANQPAVTNPLRKADPDGPSDAELPRPAGKPGRAPDPEGTKTDGAKKDGAKKDSPADGRCDECGSRVCVTKVCVPKLKEKEITKVCWDSKCEDFCVPGRSIWCGTMCRKDDCGCWSHEVWKPTCAEVRTRVVPVRKTTKRKVPGVEWKVEERCACCRAKAPCGEMPDPDGDGKAAGTKEPAGEAAPTGPAKDGAKKTAALPADKPGSAWPWSMWLR